MWFAETRRHGQPGETSGWQRIGIGPWASQERAKGVCRDHLRAEPHNRHRADYRLVRDNGLCSVDAESRAPHGERMRWSTPREE